MYTFSRMAQAHATDGAKSRRGGNGVRNGGRAERSGPAVSNPHTSYDAFKEFKCARYTGMKVGRGHHWIYDSGEWVETKVTPDKWEFHYSVPKRRKGRAPEGSGVPIGTAYHWYILADQTVTKLDANTYSTDMFGIKYKLAHKRADKPNWSASDASQRTRLIQVLREMISELEQAEPRTETPTRSEARSNGTPARARAQSRASGSRNGRTQSKRTANKNARSAHEAAE